MKSNLLLIDKDGTLVTPKSGSKFVQRPWDQQPIERVYEMLDKYHFDGWDIIVISNQGGVAAGHKSLKSAIFEMEYLLELFPQIAECFFCPDFEGEECYRVWRNDFIKFDSSSYGVCRELGIIRHFRKPNPGMLKLAMHIHSSDEVLYVGDREEDEQAALAAGVPFVWANEFLEKEKRNFPIALF